MGNFHRVVVSVATALDLLFGGLTTTQNLQYQMKKLDLCVATTTQLILLDQSLKMVVFSKIFNLS